MEITLNQHEMGILWFVVISILAISFFFWIAALISIVRNEFVGDNEKLMWAVLVIFLPLIGTILYYTVGIRRIRPQ